jgi:polysaccharide export outer membrane protein
MARLSFACAMAALTVSGCGVVYTSPSVSELPPESDAAIAAGYTVQVVELDPTTVAAANALVPSAMSLPIYFDPDFVNRQLSKATATPTLPAPTVAPIEATATAAQRATRLPPPADPQPYRLGVGDVVSIGARPEGAGAGVAPGDPATFRVPDTGSISVPGVGPIEIAGLTIEEARDRIVNAFVNAGLDPAFSFEIEDFASQNVVVSGAVEAPASLPITVTPLRLREALQRSGGVTFDDIDNAVVELTRGGETFVIPVRSVFGPGDSGDILLRDGDIVFVDVPLTELQRQQAFTEQLELRRLSAETSRLEADTARFAAETARFENERIRGLQETFLRNIELGSVDRGYAYLTGEAINPARFPLPFVENASLADVLHDDRGVPIITGDVSQIYVLRAIGEVPTEITAFHLESGNMAEMVLATRFHVTDGDVVFVAEQPITSWNRVITQLLPGALPSSIDVVAN